MRIPYRCYASGHASEAGQQEPPHSTFCGRLVHLPLPLRCKQEGQFTALRLRNWLTRRPGSTTTEPPVRAAQSLPDEPATSPARDSRGNPAPYAANKERACVGSRTILTFREESCSSCPRSDLSGINPEQDGATVLDGANRVANQGCLSVCARAGDKPDAGSGSRLNPWWNVGHGWFKKNSPQTIQPIINLFRKPATDFGFSMCAMRSSQVCPRASETRRAAIW